MTLAQLGTIILLNLAGMITPGPDVFLITRIATRSRKHAIAAVCGISTGLILWVGLTVAGTAALFFAYPSLIGVVQFLGGLMLLWMGYGMFKSGLEQRAHGGIVDPVEMDSVLGSAGANYRMGLMTNLSNPKAVIYFASIMAPFMPQNPTWWESVLVVVCVVFSALIGFSAMAWVFSTRVIRAKLLKSGAWIDLGAGVVFVLVGLFLVFEGVRVLL